MDTAATTATSAAGAPQVKRRAACEECRNKKLKCTGEHPACSRCVREGIDCVYSIQKQMGRPKKRQRTDDDDGPRRTGRPPAQPDRRQTWNAPNLGAYGADVDSMQPWLAPSGGTGAGVGNDSWDFDLHNVPRLTPDNSSSDSPPLLNLPTELQRTPSDHHHHHHQSFSHSTQRDHSSTLLLDPILGASPSTLPTCACLSTLYLTLNNLQQMEPTFAFPFALHPLREAMTTASEVLACDHCPKSFIPAMQNTQLTGTLLTAIAERFARVLEAINTEASRAEASGETKKFRLADLNTSTSHLHTGGLGCAAAFSVDLSPREWRSLAKKVVRAEVHGPGEGNNCCPYFLGVTRQMSERQERWHSSAHHLPEDCPRDVFGTLLAGRNLPREEHLCLKMAAFAEKLVKGFDWS